MEALANLNNYWGHWAGPLTILGFTIGGIALAVVLLWSIYWKGRALWRAAKNDSRKWFVALLVINTLGILEILYIYVFSKKNKKVISNEDKNSQSDSIKLIASLLAVFIVCIIILAIILWAFRIVF